MSQPAAQLVKQAEAAKQAKVAKQPGKAHNLSMKSLAFSQKLLLYHGFCLDRSGNKPWAPKFSQWDHFCRPGTAKQFVSLRPAQCFTRSQRFKWMRLAKHFRRTPRAKQPIWMRLAKHFKRSQFANRFARMPLARQRHSKYWGNSNKLSKQAMKSIHAKLSYMGCCRGLQMLCASTTSVRSVLARFQHSVSDITYCIFGASTLGKFWANAANARQISLINSTSQSFYERPWGTSNWHTEDFRRFSCCFDSLNPYN